MAVISTKVFLIARVDARNGSDAYTSGCEVEVYHDDAETPAMVVETAMEIAPPVREWSIA